MNAQRYRPNRHAIALGSAVAMLLLGLFILGPVTSKAIGAGEGDQTQIPATPEAFDEPGSQPETDYTLFRPVVPSTGCTWCHGSYDSETAPYDTWATSLMAQAARDPVWHATLAIANQDVANGGKTCIRCHAPGAFFKERAEDGLMDDFDADDFDGINCNFCHRVVNPVLGKDRGVEYPPACKDPEYPENCQGPLDPDVAIIDALAKAGHLPHHIGNANYVVDTANVRRGPYDDVSVGWYQVHGTDGYGSFVWLVYSPFHRTSQLCGTCHDVSNPLFMRNGTTGKYELTDVTQEHPTHDPADMFPEQRTYSEWLMSDFAETGVSFPDNRFGGNHPTGIMKTCQDCHMPKQIGAGCVFEQNEKNPHRDDIGQHSFSGANTWVISAIREMAGEDADMLGLSEQAVNNAQTRTAQMLRDASDMELSVSGSGVLNVRIINQTGHKLPTGYPEGRRVFINVRFYDESDMLIAERGAYNHTTATLTDHDTKVYEMTLGIDDDIAATTGLPSGEGFHLILNNEVIKDNRIPPRGVTQAELASIGAATVGYTYADDQYWDDTEFVIPQDAASAVATLYYQTSSREYMEFLRDANSTDSTGSIAHTLWQHHGKSAPVQMDSQSIKLQGAVPGDINGDGIVNGADLALLLGAWGSTDSDADLNGDNFVNGADLAILLGNWT